MNSDNQGRRGHSSGIGARHQPPIIVQLRQAAMAREAAFSAVSDRRIDSPLSISSAKRSTISASSNNYFNQQKSHPGFKSSLSNDINANYSMPEKLSGESMSSMKASRARSTLSSRSSMHMLKTRNERKRQKQYIELKTVLVDPWKQIPWNDGILEQSIPNSLEVMHKMCGPGTAFERNLRHSYQRQLSQLRIATKKP